MKCVPPMTSANKERLATIVGFLVAGIACMGYVYVDLPTIFATIIFGFGMFLMFPDRVQEFFEMIRDKIPFGHNHE